MVSALDEGMIHRAQFLCCLAYLRFNVSYEDQIRKNAVKVFRHEFCASFDEHKDSSKT